LGLNLRLAAWRDSLLSNCNDDERKYLSYNIAISLRGRKEFLKTNSLRKTKRHAMEKKEKRQRKKRQWGCGGECYLSDGKSD
jgi:hypothetical protein